MTDGPLWRTTALSRLARETFDVLVIGGGATGAGIARDAALRGLRVALCDHGDFAGQTSSQSSKLIHGGLRYLQYGNFELVFEGLTERRRLMTSAPHLCRPIEFVFPAYHGERPSLRALGAGVALYNALALWRPPAASRCVAGSDLYSLLPLLRTAGLQGAQVYTDCQTDDARLVLENILDAEDCGATVASYVDIAAPPPDSKDRWRRAQARDRASGATFNIEAHVIVNATGPFSDAISGGPPALRPTLGVHLVLDADRLPTGGRAVVLRSPRDGRLFFALPAASRTIVGTTDTDWNGSSPGHPPRPDDEIAARPHDVDYLIEAANHAFPAARVGADDVISTFAGLRPLIASPDPTPSATPREHEIWLDRRGFVTVAGGKLTTYRRMAEEAVDRLIEVLRDRGFDRTVQRCQTRDRPLPGGAAPGPLATHELASDVREHLVATYGGRAAQVLALAGGSPTLADRIDADLPYLRAEIVFAARHDHACEVEDALRRRIPIFRDMHDQGLSIASDAGAILAQEFGWSGARQERSVAAYRSAVEASRRWRSQR